MVNANVVAEVFGPESSIHDGALVHDEFVWDYVLQVPRKWLALQLVSKLLAITNISDGKLFLQIDAMHVKESVRYRYSGPFLLSLFQA